MRCPKCQSENPADSLFCRKCGTQILSSKHAPLSPTETFQTPIKGLAIGSTFAGRYHVLEDLGTGGMGRVYKVLDKKIMEKVALKVLKPEIAFNEKMIERFRNELKFARKISHRHVCRMYDLSEEEETHFITMEYVSGEDLKSLMRKIGQFIVGKAVSIAKQICEGLAEAHRLGVVHRDLKPQNIMIDKEGNTRIMDFGVARLLRTEGITETGMIIGTPEYISPEQVEGREADERSDIYSFGIILYEMVTGRLPFGGDNPLSIALKHKSEVPPHPGEFDAQIPEDLSKLILKCLEKRREKRYQKVEEIAAELEKIERIIPTTERISLDITKKRKSLPIQKNMLRWAGALILVVILMFGGYSLWKGFIQPQPDYENFVLLEVFADESKEVQENLIEYLLLRSLTASTKQNILLEEDFAAYKRKTESTEERLERPAIAITCEVYPKVTGMDIFISMMNRGKKHKQKFECKGPIDLISNKIDEIHSFISMKSDGIIGKIDGERTFSQICTDKLDALSHFLKGEEAWKKLDKDTAHFEYRSAIQNDPEFSLARLRFAEVLEFFFRDAKEDPKEHLLLALENKDRLIEYDLLRLQALMARLNSKPSEERHFIGQLTEAFPFNKEYHYIFAESYFRCGESDEAIKHYTNALDIDPDYSLAHNHIAFCYSWIGNHELAEEHFQRYVQLDKSENSYDSLAAGYMFAGRYDEAIKALNKAVELGPEDYMYRNLACNFILKGNLAKAADILKEQATTAEGENTKNNARFYLAFIEFLRGDIEKSIPELKPAQDFYSKKFFINDLQETPNLAFWLSGAIAYEKGDLRGLRDALNRMEEKIIKNKVNATNYFRIYKFYIHLKILEAYLRKDENEILKHIDEGKMIRNKMGCWSSIFNLSYFFNEYAQILIRLKKSKEAIGFLNEAIEYNPNFAPSYINLATVHLNNNNMGDARRAYQRALELLRDAGRDLRLFKEAEKIGNKLTGPVVSD